MTNDQLLDALKSSKLLNDEALNKVKREVIVSGKSPDAIISERRLVDDAKIAELKSHILKVPYQKVDLEKVEPDVLGLVPEETVRTYAVAPLEKRDDILIAGMVNPDDKKAQEALTFIARRDRMNLGVYLISYADWQAVLKKYSPYRSNVEAAVQSLSLEPGSGRRTIVFEDDMKKGGEQAPIIKIVSDTIEEAVENKASDIHIEPQEKSLRIRFRIDGQLHETASLPVEIAQAVVSRVKVLSNLKIDEMRIPQDGRFRAKIFDREIDFRVSTFPTPLGEKVAIRVLDSVTGLKTFDQLGLTGRNLKVIKEGLLKPFGMIMITGPTGSGKTTTLYALLQLINNENVNIVSLEDPVEYFVAGVNQSQVKPEIGYDFVYGLRQILRQDPDVIMVGEVRDNETASLAVQAALTGHVVLSTLHTNNATSVVPRLLDMKVESFLIPVALNLMISQRLVGVLCENCKKATEAPPEMAKIIRNALNTLPAGTEKKYEEPYKVHRSVGCAKCKGRGITGRIALFEAFRMTPELEDIINSGVSAQKIIKEAQAQGMITLRQDGVLKALQGIVSMEEVIRGTEE